MTLSLPYSRLHAKHRGKAKASSPNTKALNLKQRGCVRMNGTAPFFALTTNCTNYTNYSTAVCQLIINSCNSCNSWFGNFFIVLTHPRSLLPWILQSSGKCLDNCVPDKFSSRKIIENNLHTYIIVLYTLMLHGLHCVGCLHYWKHSAISPIFT